MEPVGLRELRQHTRHLVRRAEADETLLVTVSGRPAAVLAPASGRSRGYSRRYDEVAVQGLEHLVEVLDLQSAGTAGPTASGR